MKAAIYARKSSDDAISGAEFKNRPALLRLLDRLKGFDVIISLKLSRLGRKQTQTASVLAGIYAKGLLVFSHLTDEEVCAKGLSPLL